MGARTRVLDLSNVLNRQVVAIGSSFKEQLVCFRRLEIRTVYDAARCDLAAGAVPQLGGAKVRSSIPLPFGVTCPGSGKSGQED